MEYDGWGYNPETKKVELFETNVENPVVSIPIDELINKALNKNPFHFSGIMEVLLDKAGYVKRTESGKGVITGGKQNGKKDL